MRNGQRFSTRCRITAFSSLSMTGSMSGRGTRMSSKSAAEKTSICPALKVSKFLLRPLRKEVVCEANRQLAIAVQFVHHAIVVGIVLKSATGIDRAGDAEAVELTEEEPRGIKLIFAGELWSLGECGIENVGIRLGDEQTRRISLVIPLNLTSR